MEKVTAQKMKSSIKDFFSKYDQVRWKPRIWLHLLKKSLTKNFTFCVVRCLTSNHLEYTMSGFVCRVTFTLSRVPCAVFLVLCAAYLCHKCTKSHRVNVVLVERVRIIFTISFKFEIIVMTKNWFFIFKKSLIKAYLRVNSKIAMKNHFIAKFTFHHFIDSICSLIIA